MAKLSIHKEYITRTVCPFFYHGDFNGNAYGYSLLGIDISVPTTADEEGGWEVKPPRLLVQIAAPGRLGLACAKLGSRIYFLGGVIPLERNNWWGPYDCPADVQVYDPTAPDNNANEPLNRVTEVKPMNSGKVSPITFEVKGKLYVLGGRGPFDFKVKNEYCMFEEYDPAENQWTKLADPPIDSELSDYYWWRCYVMRPNRVLILGSKTDIFAFNPQKNEWSRFIDTGIGRKFIRHPLLVKDCFYGVSRGVVSKLGPCSSFEDDQPIYATVWPTDMDWGSQPSAFTTSLVSDTVICHLGDGYFCVLQPVTSLLDVSEPCEPDVLPCKLNLTIQKELLGDQTCLKLKFLHHDSLKFSTNKSEVILKSFHVISAEEVGGKNIETYLEGRNERIHVDFGNIETKLEEENKRDDEKIETNLEHKSKGIQVDFNNIETKLEHKSRGIQVDSNNIETNLKSGEEGISPKDFRGLVAFWQGRF